MSVSGIWRWRMGLVAGMGLLAAMAAADDAPTAGAGVAAELGRPFTNGVPARLECAIVLPDGAPKSRALLSVTDRDGLWFQQLCATELGPGTNNVAFSLLGEEAERWEALGHGESWNRRSMLNPKSAGIRVFATEKAGAETAFELACAKVALEPLRPPMPYDIRTRADDVGVFELFEARFRLPDEYANPFDPDEVSVDAILREEWDGGAAVTIPCFFTQDHIVLTNSLSDVTVPHGRPEWALRHSPLNPGRHSCRIVARDATGVCTSAPVYFDAHEGDPSRGYIHVSAGNPRRLEVGGKTIFPIGHNVRYPFDTRMDDQFPWRLRRDEGFLAYRRYFADMAKAGEDLAEVWMCQWSFGLEWSEGEPRYHGVGDYNLGNAWQLDQVLDMARANGVRVNLVLNNHGRAGLGYDAEWGDSPYNAANGGRIAPDDPLAFFADPWAMKMQERILRYTVARWGWDPTIFAWELWSELDLCGPRNSNAQNDSRVVEWHRHMASYLKRADLGRHMVSTHTSSDFHAVGKELASMPELDLCCVDAYHFSPFPLHIAALVEATARNLAVYCKPVLVTEFGGSSMGGGLSHLRCELHAALWSSACSTLAATPLFWWWGLIEEQGLYGEYAAIRTFTDSVPYGDNAFAATKLSFDKVPEGPFGIRQAAISSGTNLCAWVFTERLAAKYFGEEKGAGAEPEPLDATWSPVTNGTYRVAFCSTETGLPLLQRDFRATTGSLKFTIPVFDGDIAIRAWLLP